MSIFKDFDRFGLQKKRMLLKKQTKNTSQLRMTIF